MVQPEEMVFNVLWTAFLLIVLFVLFIICICTAEHKPIGEPVSSNNSNASQSHNFPRSFTNESTFPYSNKASVYSIGDHPYGYRSGYSSRPFSFGHVRSYSGQSNKSSRTMIAFKITLYHYTTIANAKAIAREKLIRSSTMSGTPWKNRQHGCGVYFTALGPSTDPVFLAKNNFTNVGTHVTRGLYRKVQYVVQITFHEYEVEMIKCGDRDIYLYSGSIDLRNYTGRYRIYENPNYYIGLYSEFDDYLNW